jgi:membrane protease YdiL (CAAX protease family)
MTAREGVGRYTLRQMSVIWILSVAPMVVLGWVVAPLVGDSIHEEEGLVRAGFLTVGLAWLFVYALILVRQEEGDLCWPTVKRRLRLNPPISPKTGARGGRLWWWVVLLVVLFGVYNVLVAGSIDDAVSSLIPAIAEPDRYSLDSLLDSDERLAALEGAWWIVVLFTALGFFNIFGEEFIFRGILLPKMPEAFSRWPWVANGIIFGLYHMHQPWGIPSAMIDGALLLALPAWYFRSTTVALIVHGSQAIFFIFIALGVVLGMA